MSARDITQPTISQYINQLKIDKQKLVTFLNRMGYPSSSSDTFTKLCDKLQEIPSPNQE